MPRVPDSPCPECGAMLWRGSKSKPIGETVCNPCRRARFEHGTAKGYRDHKCRCHQCSAWNREAARLYRQQRREAGRPLGGNSGPWINPNVRAEVFERDGWTCQLCNGPVDRDADPQSDWFPSLDHIVPQSKGGGHDADNLRTAHRWCNSIRGAEERHSYLFVEVP